MALTRQQKEEIVASLAKDIAASTSLVFIKNNGLTVAEMRELRNKLREGNASLVVAKNTLIDLALKQAKVAVDLPRFEGPVGVVIGKGDAVVPARESHAFAKKHDKLELRVGVLEGKVLSLDEVKALALLPSREELLAKAVGSIAAPLSGFVRVLSGVPRNVVGVLAAIKDAKASQTPA